MKKSVYSRPSKPMFITVQRRNSRAIPKAPEINEPLVVDKFSECHVTPFAVARRMVEYLGPQGDYNTLEPSAGTGALVSALLASGHSQNEICAVERHHKLAAQVGKLGVPVIQACFLDYAEEVKGKVEFPRIIMNPPFSQVRKHIKAALSLLGRNGHDEPAALVALVPITYEHEDAETLETLPEDTFSMCTVRTKIVRIER
ncbi:methyltransferase type 11 [Roseibium sp. SCP14]|uniref:methyltransferase type 11 n=1 Tax=Roseibium sp. SCP14 TaxID=3141375 RepID=UPI00333556C0